MQREKLIAVGIAIALQTYYVPAIAADNDDDSDCPTNISVLSKKERDKLSTRCLADYEEQDNHWGWVAGGVAALAAGVAIGIDNNGSGHSQHNNPPVIPPDDGGDVIPTPPGGDGDVTPPDDGGDVIPTPPDDGGDVTPPDDGGDVTPTPPDDGGDVTPPDDGGDVTPTPPDDGGDVTPPDTTILTFSNGVTLDKGKETLSFDDLKLDSGKHLGGATFSYAKQGDQWQLTTADGKILQVSGWNVTDDNEAIIEGTQENGLYWKYDSRGYLIIADAQTTVISGDDESHTAERGIDISGEGKTGVVISGDRTNNTLNGDSTVSDGATGMVITGEDTTNTISGHSTINGATGALISGDGSTTHISGNIDVSNGSTGVVIDGDNTTLDSTGTATISGAGSTGLTIMGDKARFTNAGELNVSEGGTGAKISGDDVVVDNTGHSKVDGENSTGLNIEGNGALIISEGDQTITRGGTGTHIDGNNARIANTGNITVDGIGSIGTAINGDNASITQAGDLLVTNGAIGIIVNGTGNKVSNIGNTTVRDQDSIGFTITGEQATFSNKGDIDVSLNGTGAEISGNNSTINLDGKINVISNEGSDGIFHGATGVVVSGDNVTTDITGDVNILSTHTSESILASDETLTGVTINGDDNNISLDGALNISMAEQYTNDNQYMDTTGLSIHGDNNTIDINGGLNVNYQNVLHGRNSFVVGIDIDGNSDVSLSGNSQVNITDIQGGNVELAHVQNGGSLTLTEDSNLTISVNIINAPVRTGVSLLRAEGNGSSIENKGSINSKNAVTLIGVVGGATAKNSGDISVSTSGDDYSRGIAISASGEGSIAENSAGGNITLTAGATPYFSTSAYEYPQAWYKNTQYGLLASEQGSVINDAGATISVAGAGVYAMGASQGTAQNAGDIYVNGYQQQLDDNGDVIGENYWHTDSHEITSAGMVAGSDNIGSGNATAINTGTITVNNAGYGMTAMSGGTAINQGTINLTADDGVTGETNQLVGMAAFFGGTVVNDSTGVINIDADYGQPFYADASSTVVNYGTVCIGDDCQNSESYNPTDDYISLVYDDEAIANVGEAVDLYKNALIMGDVTNSGTVNNNALYLKERDSALTNTASGIINSAIQITDGTLNNEGTVNAVTVNSGIFNNDGTVNKSITMNGGTLNNLPDGIVQRSAKLNNNAVVNNSGTWYLGYVGEGAYQSTLDINGNSVFNNSGELIIDNAENDVNFRDNSRLYNTGHIKISDAKGSAGLNVQSGTAAFINAGVVDATAKSVMASAANAGSSDAFFWNQQAGVINYDVDNGKAISFTHSNYVAENDGTMNISGNNAYGMYGSHNAQLVNNGTINLGTKGTTDTGMTAMALDANATADAVIENNGTINIYASNSYAFSVAGAGHVVNNGTVVIADDVTGSGLIKQGDNVNVEGTNGNNGNSTEVHYADYILPDVPDPTVSSGSSSSSSSTNNLNGYVVGTSADGSAGQLKVSNASMDGVGINTGFTAGTADTTVTFDNVVEGNNLTDAAAITSTSVVWNAQGSQDADGNVDVTMTKNAYADVATDSSVSDVASALDAGYTNNELYTSLNVGSTAELNSALKQVSGSQAHTVFREARVLSNRFSMLADAAPQIKDGLAFNVVAKGDPRAELGNDTQYDMLALRQKLDLSENQNLTLEYGIARLDGDGSKTAGDNGLTGGYSQFFGLKHSMALNEGLAWKNSLRYDVHNLDSSRSVSYGDTNKVADSNARQQYLEFRSEGAKTFTMLNDTLKVTPYAGVKFRHTLEGSYKERSAGDFNLSMNAGSETAVDSIVGMKFDYTAENGWSASATLEGGPNLSYSKSQRTASLQGAAGQSFSVDDDQKGGGINGLATVGVKYSAKDASLNLDAYQWKEDNINDKGFMLNFRKTFR